MTEEKKIIIPFIYKKYEKKDGSTIIKQVIAKRSKPEHWKGRVPPGSKIEKDELNEPEDAEKMAPIPYKGKKFVIPEEKKGGFLNLLAPIAKTLLSGLFGGARVKKLKQGLPVAIDDVMAEKAIKEMTVEKVKNALKSVNLKANLADIKKVVSLMKQELRKAKKEGGLFALPHRRAGLTALPHGGATLIEAEKN